MLSVSKFVFVLLEIIFPEKIFKTVAQFQHDVINLGTKLLSTQLLLLNERLFCPRSTNDNDEELTTVS